MSVSSGLKNAVSEAVSWTVAAAIIAGGLVYHEEVKTGLYLALGTPLTSLAETREPGTTPTRAPESASSSSIATVELKAKRNGHFLTEASVNGRSIEVMVDTGASIVALTYEDAERAGIYVKPSDFTHRVSTANGVAKVAPVMLDRVQIGEILVRDVRAAVSEPGKLNATLLGMTFLGRLSRTEMRQGTLILQE
jgi:aspartyl protease family protein